MGYSLLLLTRFVVVLATILSLIGCENKNIEPPDCGLIKNENQSALDISILFIGTSHTYYNDLPGLVKKIANSMGDKVYSEMTAPGGYDFERHFKLEETITAINSRQWDYIVLQESGWRTALPASMAEESVYPFADSLKNLIKASNPMQP